MCETRRLLVRLKSLSSSYGKFAKASVVENNTNIGCEAVMYT